MRYAENRFRSVFTIVMCLASVPGVFVPGSAWADSAGALTPHHEKSLLRISAARTVTDTGLIAYLVRQFRKENPDVHVQLQAVGALLALEHGYEGTADLIITHYPPEEQRLVSLGHGRERVEFMRSEYAIFGPRQDSLQLATAGSHDEALQRLQAAEVDMLVPSPRSGTYFRLQELWASAGIQPDWVGYENTGTSALATLLQAADFNAYAFADMGLYLVNRDSIAATLGPLYRDRISLKNAVSAIIVDAETNPGVNAVLARRFLDYLISAAGQNAITVFSQQLFHEDIYLPSAHEDQSVINLKLLTEIAEERRLRYLMMAIGVLLLLLVTTALWFTRRVARLERAHLLVEQERKSAERSREIAEQAERAKAGFLATVSHEIRGPAGSIRNMAQLLREADLPEEQRRFARVLHQSSEFLLYIVNDVLDLSRIESGKLRLESANIDIRELVENLVTSLQPDADARGLRLDCTIDRAIPQVLRGDPLRLQQILFNLAGNAIKFTPQGAVAVSVSLQEQDENACVLSWEVRDTGIGIEPAQQPRLFDLYVQGDDSIARRYGGSGMGLAISRQLVELMDGQIGVESVPGQGARFWYTTRLTPGDAPLMAPADMTPAVEALPPLRGRVLFVEDDPANRRAGADLLELMGCEVDTVSDGREAVDAVMQGGYDLVLMDCDLPVMDGYAATRSIRRWEADQDNRMPVPIVAMTGSIREGVEQRCLNVGMDAYLSKPYRKEQLHRILSRLLPVTVGESA